MTLVLGLALAAVPALGEASGIKAASKAHVTPPGLGKHPNVHRRAGAKKPLRNLRSTARQRHLHRAFRVPTGARMGPIVITNAHDELDSCATVRMSWGWKGVCAWREYEASGLFGWWRYDYYYSYNGYNWYPWYSTRCTIRTNVCWQI